jgi:hypothetical protein
LVTRLANSRRARGDYTAEQILREILWAMEIPCDKGNFKVDGYRPDVAVPSNEALKKIQKNRLLLL